MSSLPRADKTHKGVHISANWGCHWNLEPGSQRGLGEVSVEAVLETPKVKAPMELGPHPLYIG